MLNDATLVERLSDWAQTTERGRFWSVATTSDDRIVVLLPTSSTDFVVGLTTSDTGAIQAFASDKATPNDQHTMLVGHVDEDPTEPLGTTVVWLRELAGRADIPAPTRAQFAFASARLAAALGDEDGHREATRIAHELSR